MVGPGESGGHAAAFEIFALVLLLAVGLVAVAFVEPGDTGQNRVGRMLDAAARDALGVLDALPAHEEPYASRLEELVTLAAAGSPKPLEEEVSALLPPGAAFEVELDNLAGGRLHLAGEHAERAAASPGIPLAPRWSQMIARADVEQHAGASALDVVVVRGVLVRLSYADTTTAVTLTLPNGHEIALPAGDVVRSSLPSPPEMPLLAGYAVPYDTSSPLAWSTDVANVAQDETAITPAVDPDVGGPAVLYYVHPRYAAAAELSQALLDAHAGVTFETAGGVTEFTAGDTVPLEYDAGTLPGVAAVEATIRVWDAVGRVVASETVPAENGRIAGTFEYEIPRATLWGTHVAELEVLVHDPLDATETYLAHRLAAFNVNPSAGFSAGVAHVPPIYRVVLHAWAPEDV